jgi:hypothetical protein
VEDVFEYSSDLNELNAYDALEYFKYDYNKESTFFTLNGGLGQIIDALLDAIKKTQSYKRNHIKIQNLSNVENVSYNKSNLFSISAYNYKKLIYIYIYIRVYSAFVFNVGILNRMTNFEF